MMTLTIDGYNNKHQNKYYKIYKKLISKRLLTPPSQDLYCEIHHILPRCMGGSNHQLNLVCLTAKEHFIAHLLLTKFVIGTDRLRILSAFFCMKNVKNQKNQTNRRYSTSRQYELLKDEYSKLQSIKIKDQWDNGSRDSQLEFMKNNSPFKNKNIHDKTIRNRERNGTNIWKTNNPMKNPIKAKQIASKRSGKNHYLTKQTCFEYSLNSGKTWQQIDKNLTVEQICKKYNWSRATFYYILDGKIPKRGPMKEILIRRIKEKENESN